MSEPFDKKPLGRKIITLVILIVVYFVIAIPFSTLDVIPGFANIRPLEMLEPIYGIFFGLPGCIIMGPCNLIMDAVSNSLKLSSAAGFIANILGPMCYHVYWTYISRTDFDLRSPKNMLKFVLITIVSALLEMLIITPSVAHYYPNVNYIQFAAIVLLNNILFPVLLGIPVIILMQEELGFVPCGRKQCVPNGNVPNGDRCC